VLRCGRDYDVRAVAGIALIELLAVGFVNANGLARLAPVDGRRRGTIRMIRAVARAAPMRAGGAGWASSAAIASRSSR